MVAEAAPGCIEAQATLFLTHLAGVSVGSISTRSRRRLGVALVVDPPLADEIDGMRRALGDPSLGRVPAHLTLVPPINVGGSSLAGALSGMRRAAAAVTGPLRLTLGAVSTFLPANPVVYLPAGGDLDGLARVRDAVFQPPLARKLSWPWVPHVTLGDGIGETAIPAALTALAHYNAVWTVDRVVLLEQRPGRVWAPLADASLGRMAVVGAGGLALELAAGRMLGPDVYALLEDEGAAEPGEPVNGGSAPRRPVFAPIVMTARREGAVTGFAAAWAYPDHARVSIYVGRSYRRQGIGSHLLHHLEAAARNAEWPYDVLEATGPEGFFLSRSRWSVVTQREWPSTAPAS